TTFGRIGVKVWIYKGEVLTQTLRTTPRTLDTTKPYEERRERRPRRDGDRRPRRDGQGNGFQRREGGFNRNNGSNGNRPQGGYRKPAEKKEGGAQ
ncbi:MAG: 30S ribosomal protein S3, partial [Oscillospiraceae bacterium]|nr:30S ribosomal protein S3 [Oscillospiraceae bacterium]